MVSNPPPQPNKKKTPDKQDFITIGNFCSSNDTIKKIRRDHRKGESVRSLCLIKHSFLKVILLLFIFGRAGSSLLCSVSLLVESRGVQASHHGGPTRCRAGALGRWAQRCSSRALQSGATAAVHGLSYSAAEGSAGSRDRTHVSCSSKQILYHRATSL